MTSNTYWETLTSRPTTSEDSWPASPPRHAWGNRVERSRRGPSASGRRVCHNRQGEALRTHGDPDCRPRHDEAKPLRHEGHMTLPMSSRSQAPNPDPLGDAETAELVDWVARGNEDAFSELYRRSSGLVYGVALRVTRDSVLAQDVLQETFLQAWREANRFDPAKGSVRGWLLTIAHRRAVDRVRHEQRSGTRETAWALRELDTEHDSVAEIVELRAEHRRVRAALDGLTTLQRQAIELAYVRGLTHNEVAVELGIPLGTAKTRLRDGLMKLRESMGTTP